MFSQFATGVCILLTEESDSLFKGVTINSFSSLSLDPLLINFSLKSKSQFFLSFNIRKRFSINILSAKQQSIAQRCAVSGGASFSSAEIVKDSVSYIPDCLVSIFCEVKDSMAGGDHVIFVCEVLNMVRNASESPLLFFDSRYCIAPL